MENNLTLIIIVFLTALIGGVIYYFFFFNKKEKKIIYWDNKQPKNEYLINKKNQKTGTEKFYYRSGKLNKIRIWKDNLLQGTETIYYENGKIYIEKNYLNNVLNGEYIVFSPNGVQLEKFIYNDGEIISSQSFHSHTEHSKIDFHTEPLLNNDIIKNFEKIEEEYAIIRDEEDTKDEEKKSTGFWAGVKKISKNALGVQAYQDRNSAIRIKEISEKLYDEALKTSDKIKEKLDEKNFDLSTVKIASLKNTTGYFLQLLKDMGQSNKINEYAISTGIGFSLESIDKMEKIDMEISKALASTTKAGSLGAAASIATPMIVKTAIFKFGAASTGTAIATLKGAAATNATLAWLGGGSLATGGGGIAAGTAVLSGITAGATAGVALLATGYLASTHYSGQLTKTKEWQKKIEIEVNNIKLHLEFLEGISRRIDEISVLTQELEKRIMAQLRYLQPLTVDYDTKDPYYTQVFQKNGRLIISMNELAQTQLIDKKGEITSNSIKIIENTQ